MPPALPGVEGTVVLDPVFQFLVENGLEKGKLNQLLWIIPEEVQNLANSSRCDLKKAKGFKELRTPVTNERDEGQCIVAVESRNWYLGYDKGELHYQWKERK
ncbi:hypothetical protein FOVSG1_015111 [Fusarium oxysporum f. sp. vasinfectum]